MLQPTSQLKGLRFLAVSFLCATALVPGSFMRAQGIGGPSDILYIGDGSDNTVKRFDAGTGKFLDANAGSFVLPGAGGLLGPRGILIDSLLGGNLIVVNQNVNLNFAGEILEYSVTNGSFIRAIVPCSKPTGRICDPNAPFAPRGIVRSSDGTLSVADLGKKETGDASQFSDQTGAFVGKLDFTGFTGDSFGEYHPRSLVFGPDGLLYVSIVGNLDPNNPHFDPLAGFVLRFQRNGTLRDVFATDQTCPALHRPEGLVFGPDGKLYVTSFRASADDTDKIVIFDLKNGGSCGDNIDLDVVGQDRAFAQALLFGPGGRLFVPINNVGTPSTNPFTGDVRRYDVHTKRFDVFVRGLAGPANLTQPWYLTFGKTDPGTLAYNP